MNENSKTKKFLLPTLILILIVIIFGFIVLAKTKKTNDVVSDGQVILFYGQECPHCQNLEQWISANKIAEKVLFENKEVYHNTANAQLLASKAKICGLDTNSIGVPFLWDGSRCYSGEDTIQKFFEEKTSVK